MWCCEVERLGLGENRDSPAELLETHLIRLLDAPDLDHVPGARANEIVRLHLASRNALLTTDIRASFWIRGRLSGLNKQRMSLVDSMLGSRGGSSLDGTTSRAVNELVEEYQRLADDAEVISRGYQVRDQMLHREILHQAVS